MKELINFDKFEKSKYVLATKIYPFANEKVKGILLFQQCEPSYGIQYYVVSIQGYSKTNYDFKIETYDNIEEIDDAGIVFNNKECDWTPNY